MKRHFRQSPIPNPQSLRIRAFTLVEMLVVITIIGILAGLVTAAAVVARRRAKIAAIVFDISQIDIALKSYKEKFGEYPPDLCSVHLPPGDPLGEAARNAVLRHLAKAFPRYTGATTWASLQAALSTAAPAGWGVDINTYGAHGALTFWLGGKPIWNVAGTGITGFKGFSANPADPFDNSASRIPPFIDFELSRVRPHSVSTTVFQYYPSGVTGNADNNSYVYFRAENGNYTYDGQAVASAAGTNIKRWAPSATEVVIPAADWRLSPGLPYVWINPRLYQIFSAGMDAAYSMPVGYVSGTNVEPLKFPYDNNYGQYTYDDVTNFSNGTLEDAIP